MPRGVYKRKPRSSDEIRGVSSVYCASTRETYVLAADGGLCTATGDGFKVVRVAVGPMAEDELRMYRLIAKLLKELDETMPAPHSKEGD